MADMEYRQLGSSGLMVSVVGLGCNNLGRRLDQAATTAVVHAAIDHGVTLLDVADVYGDPRGRAEELLGVALRGRRRDVVLATKFGMDMGGANGPDWGARGSRRYVVQAVEASLRRLQTDHIDLYQYHQPDGITPIDETLAALDYLVTAGKIRYIGSSNFAGWQVADAELTSQALGSARFVSAQNRYSLLTRAIEDEVVPACEAYGIGVLPYFPLESGLLTGKYRRGEGAPGPTRLSGRPEVLEQAPWDLIEAITAFAQERGTSLLGVAIGGLASRPAVASVIAGAMSPGQLAANVAAAQWLPSPDDAAALDALLTDSGRSRR